MARKKKKETTLSSNVFLPEPIYKREKRGVKAARPDIILSEDELSPEIMQDFIFAEIGGQEVLDISRSDFVNSPLNQQYSPTPGTGTSYIKKEPIVFSDGIKNTFASFGILLDDNIPEDTTVSAVELDSFSNEIIIKIANAKDTDNVEIQFLPYANVVSDIIFEGI